MNKISLYPMRFEPLYQYRLWGSRNLANLLSEPLPGDGPIGEAWLLSDRDDFNNIVANGHLKGQSLGQLLKNWPEQMLGKLSRRFKKFPLLLKFLDVHDFLSVQVHPSDSHPEFLSAGETGKTEAWVVLEATSESRIYAGLKPESSADDIRAASNNGTIVEKLEYFTPKSGDGVFIPAGTVHALGGDVVVFEVKQNSDVTFRLYDWNHVDTKTGKRRTLQVEQAIASINFTPDAVGLVVPVVEQAKPALRERLFLCEHFGLWRFRGENPFTVGEAEIPRILVCLSGNGQLVNDGVNYFVGKGDVWLLPAETGTCVFQPGSEVNILEISLPE